jgi:hypothetical protein
MNWWKNRTSRWLAVAWKFPGKVSKKRPIMFWGNTTGEPGKGYIGGMPGPGYWLSEAIRMAQWFRWLSDHEL